MANIKIIGGGLAGSECAYQLAKRGHNVTIVEMRPIVNTAVHKTGNFAELVCSNSLKSTDVNTSQGLLKKELEMLDCMILDVASQCSVPAGGALAVDREKFSTKVQEVIDSFDNVHVIREECTQVVDDNYDFVVVASGPLTSDLLAEDVMKMTGSESLYFYDAVAPIVTSESIDKDNAFFARRYNKGGDDYLNCPMNREEYYEFVRELVSADTVILKDFEKKDVFNACMPVEVMAKRGEESLRFGPLRPVGIYDPKTNVRPYAVVQLRKEDNYDQLYNLVGFQTNLKFGEQERVFKMIPALKNAEFVRYGVMHRNTFINAPRLLNGDFSLKSHKNVYFAGQISGVEGYLESTMSGLISALSIDSIVNGKEFLLPPKTTAIGSLIAYITTETKNFQPMHVSYSLIPELEEHVRDKKLRKAKYSERALVDMQKYVELL
ncbi:MAG: methylenetetrahydrofolate--tRNA-(uracil(54)-C(5))-methyltransferase (FADH(2)-oxidizing) TrmFO [Clostridia bacterium]|nr:methylenetetrahydrofolate--tRNA-(uracil(54)-C(5))-methyltransferase (FADH(2)-oxidizing) TrmFO [Clostridia bacterium]